MSLLTSEYRSHSTERQTSSNIQFSSSLRSSHSACAIDLKSRTPSSSSSSSSSSSLSFSLDNETKDENMICSSLSTRPIKSEYVCKSNSLDSGYKTLSATSHGTSHTNTIDEENERNNHNNNLLQIASSPSSCSSSSYVVSSINYDQKLNSKIDFPIDDEDDVDNKQSKMNLKLNTDGKNR